MDKLISLLSLRNLRVLARCSLAVILALLLIGIVGATIEDSGDTSRALSFLLHSLPYLALVVLSHQSISRKIARGES